MTVTNTLAKSEFFELAIVLWSFRLVGNPCSEFQRRSGLSVQKRGCRWQSSKIVSLRDLKMGASMKAQPAIDGDSRLDLQNSGHGLPTTALQAIRQARL
jgi:hypothetical protein